MAVVLAKSPMQRPEALQLAVQLYARYHGTGRPAPAYVERSVFAATRDLRRAWEIEAGDVVSLAFAPDDRALVALTGAGRALVWNSENGERQRELDSDAALRSIALSHDGQRLLTIERPSPSRSVAARHRDSSCRIR